MKGRCPGPLDDGDKLLSRGDIDELWVGSKEVDEIIGEKGIFWGKVGLNLGRMRFEEGR